MTDEPQKFLRKLSLKIFTRTARCRYTGSVEEWRCIAHSRSWYGRVYHDEGKVLAHLDAEFIEHVLFHFEGKPLLECFGGCFNLTIRRWYRYTSFEGFRRVEVVEYIFYSDPSIGSTFCLWIS
jgi:hypothetical protein